MSYLVLARKYRPLTFKDIVGQEAITTTLQNAVAAKRLAHAFLFFGSRGVGKTTTARILAKAANCQKGPTPDPCNQCTSCQEITKGSSLDVLEIDAASNTGVDHVREAIIDTVALVPSRDRYKIFIIDEVHMLSTSAFNALLKTLEEPPAHVLFILATTEPQKVPATILSRCQRYRFRPVASEQIVAQLKHILAQEKLKAEEAALAYIAKAATGSLRDAISLLDQALSFCSGEVTFDNIQELLGFLPQDMVKDFSEKILACDKKGLLESIGRLVEEGYDLSQMVRDVRDHLRQRLLVAAGALSGESRSEGRGEEKATQEQLLRLVKGLTKCLDELRFSDQPRLLVELHFLKLASPAVDIGEVISKLEELASEDEKPEAPEPVAVVTAVPAPAAVLSSTDAWLRFTEKVKTAKPSVAAYLAGAWHEDHGQRWSICFDQKFQRDGVQRHLAVLEQILSSLQGRPMKIICETRETPAKMQTEEDTSAKPSDVFEDPTVKTIMDTFQGRLRSLE